MNKFRLLEKMKTESSPKLTQSKTHKNKSTNSQEQKTNNEPPKNSVELSGLNSIKMSNKILQWNSRWIRANYEELLLLLNKSNPKVVCLQEIFLKDKNQLKMEHFQSYNHLYKDGHRAFGGVSILVRKDIPQSQIQVDTYLQAIVVKATLHKPIHICSIYTPPHDPISDIKMN